MQAVVARKAARLVVVLPTGKDRKNKNVSVAPYQRAVSRHDQRLIMPSNILYVCQNALGDIITTLPSIHFLRRRYPLANLDVCISATYADLLSADPAITRLIPVPSEWLYNSEEATNDCWNQLGPFRPYYDVIVDSMCLPQTANLIQALRPAKAVGIGFAETIHAYDLALPVPEWQKWGVGGRKVTDSFGDIVRMLSDDYEDSSPCLYVTDQAAQWGSKWLADQHPRASRNPVVALNPGAGNPDKRWPMTNFLETARVLAQNGFVPLFIFGPKENDLYQACAEKIKNHGYLIYKSDSYQVQPLAGILRHCSLLITNDCAVMHVGAAIGCRVLAIFGPTNPDIWFPYSKAGQIVIGGSRPEKPSCPFPTLPEVQEVLNKIVADIPLQSA